MFSLTSLCVIMQDLEDVDPPKQFNRSTYFTVAGERRQTEIPMPCSLLGSKPGEVINRHVSGLMLVSL